MDPTPKQQVVERLRQANNVLVTVSRNPTVDELCAAIGLSLMLNKLGKHTTTVFSGQIPDALRFLEPEKTIHKDVDGLRDFIIALDKDKADKLRYKVDGDVVKIFITPYHSTITQADLQFSQGDFNVDAVVALGVQNRTELDEAITAHGRILHDATVIAATAGTELSDLGSINWQEPEASSLSEMLVSISEAFQGGLLDPQLSNALLTGIVSATERFSNQKTSPKVMTMAAQLMAAGANQQLITSNLQLDQRPPEPPIAEQKAPEPEKEKDSGELRLHDDEVVKPEPPKEEPPAPPPPPPPPPPEPPKAKEVPKEKPKEEEAPPKPKPAKKDKPKPKQEPEPFTLPEPPAPSKPPKLEPAPPPPPELPKAPPLPEPPMPEISVKPSVPTPPAPSLPEPPTPPEPPKGETVPPKIEKQSHERLPDKKNEDESISELEEHVRQSEKAQPAPGSQPPADNSKPAVEQRDQSFVLGHAKGVSPMSEPHGEPSLGGTFNATSEKSHKDKEFEATSGRNRSLLSHDGIPDEGAPPPTSQTLSLPSQPPAPPMPPSPSTPSAPPPQAGGQLPAVDTQKMLEEARAAVEAAASGAEQRFEPEQRTGALHVPDTGTHEVHIDNAGNLAPPPAPNGSQSPPPPPPPIDPNAPPPAPPPMPGI